MVGGSHGGGGFVEPEVVPPAHRDQIAAPLVGQLMRNCVSHQEVPVDNTSLSLRQLSVQSLLTFGAAALTLHHSQPWQPPYCITSIIQSSMSCQAHRMCKGGRPSSNG